MAAECEFNGSIRYLNVSQKETVHQRIVLVHGVLEWKHEEKEAGEVSEVLVSFTSQSSLPPFPSQRFPCFKNHFKALIHLEIGPNQISFQCISPSSSSSLDLRLENSKLEVVYLPLFQNPPLHLAILVASDSKLQFDVPLSKEANRSLEDATKKFRTIAYLWQAFTGEQMHRQGHGRRTFRLEEDFLLDTLSSADAKHSTRRSTAQVYVLKTSKTTSEIRRTKAIGKEEEEEHKEDLYETFLEAIRNDEELGPKVEKNGELWVAGLVLDSHWDSFSKQLTGHAALGGSNDSGINLGMFGSHLVHSWPSCLEEIVPCFMDETPIDETRLANDSKECGMSWKALCIGAGAFLHEVGHCLTLTHTPSGIMSRGFRNFNRTFMVKERLPDFSIKSLHTDLDEEGSHWHPLDTVRLRFHPCLRLPSDTNTHHTPDSRFGARFYPVEGEKLLIQSSDPSSGINVIEFIVNDRVVHSKSFYVLPVPVEVILSKEDADVKNVFTSYATEKVKLEVTCINQRASIIEDVKTFISESFVNLEHLGLGQGFKSPKCGLGLSTPNGVGSIPFEAWLQLDVSKMTFYHDHWLRCIEIETLGGEMKRIGTVPGGVREAREEKEEEGIRKTVLEINGWTGIEDEHISEVRIRAGYWVDGIQVQLSTGRTSGWMGGDGGTMNVLKPPKQKKEEGIGAYRIVGIYGTASDEFVDSLGIIYFKTQNN